MHCELCDWPWKKWDGTMTDDTCRRWREQLGAYALGQLPPDERDELSAHLDTCSTCNDELDEILPVARLLPMADPERVVNKPVTPPHVATQLFEQIARERRRQNRRAYFARGTVGIAAAVMAFMLLAPMINSSSDDGRTVMFAQTAAASTGGSPDNATARVVEQPWGTEIHLTVAGLSGRQTVWFEQPDGTRASAGSFDAGSGAAGQEIELQLSTAFKAKDAVALCVSPPEKPAILRAPLKA